MKLFKMLTLVFFTSCFTFCNSQEVIVGNGIQTTKTVNPKPFTGIITSNNATIHISQGDKYELIVTGDSNIIEQHLKIKTKNNNCIIKLEKGNYRNYNLNIEITMPKIQKIDAYGSDEIEINDFTNLDDLSFHSVGSGNININRINPIHKCSATIIGSGDIIFNEEVSIRNIDLRIIGSGKFRGYNITSKSYRIVNAGSGDCEVNVTDNLSASIPGSSDVYYKGNPKIQFSSPGSGRLINAN
ncbi:head GIN domain-containing protein [uncultured Tenacibaculum sp.]|uniref:head GIN domain-containing protein n=1 Tax=uncultured Tenacibaculum sp. TaxID=174713 RepID=UPI00262CB22A|nr:head GIN domain-containing protein [uncultured Tenacibaculum sp.]